MIEFEKDIFESDYKFYNTEKNKYENMKFEIIRECKLARIRYGYFKEKNCHRPYYKSGESERPIYNGANCGSPIRNLSTIVQELKEIK